MQDRLASTKVIRGANNVVGVVQPGSAQSQPDTSVSTIAFPHQRVG